MDKTSSEPLYLQIRNELQKQIHSGELSPGSQIPSEQQLAASYGVSRMTARKSVEGLVAKGLLFRQPGKGTFVAENVLSYGFSTMLSFSRTLRARGYAVDTKVLRQDVIPGPPDVLEKLNLNPASEVLIIRRLRFVEGKPAAIHTSYLDSYIFAPILQADLSRESLLVAIEQASGVRMAYSKDSVRAGLANIETSSLLEVPVGSPVLEVEGIAFDENGEPTRLTRAIYRGDKFRLAVTNTANQVSSLAIADEES